MKKAFKLNSFLQKEFIKEVRRNPSFFFYLGELEWEIRRSQEITLPNPHPLKEKWGGRVRERRGRTKEKKAEERINSLLCAALSFYLTSLDIS